MEGWIKIHRKMVDWEWYNDNNVKIIFLHLLLTANHKEKKWQGITIKRGQKLTSIQHLAEENNLTIQQTRTALNKLKTTNEITIKATNKYTLITIEKYSDYQDNDEDNNKQNNKQITNEQQTNNKQITTNKNDKNNKNEKNEKKIKEKNIKKEKSTEIDLLILQNFSDEKIKDTLYEFVKMRKSIKKPLTTRGLELLIKKLYLMTTDIDEQIEILNNSIMNNWQGIFPLKQNNQRVVKGSFDDFRDLWEEARIEDEQARNGTNNNSFSW